MLCVLLLRKAYSRALDSMQRLNIDAAKLLHKARGGQAKSAVAYLTTGTVPTWVHKKDVKFRPCLDTHFPFKNLRKALKKTCCSFFMYTKNLSVFLLTLLNHVHNSFPR